MAVKLIKWCRGRPYILVKHLWFDHEAGHFNLGDTYVVDFAASRKDKHQQDSEE